MADLADWTPERLRALDVAVAEARGWIPGRDEVGRVTLPPKVSLGCRDTFEIQDEERIDTVAPVVVGGRWGALWDSPHNDDNVVEASTPAIAICLAYLAAKGRPFPC